MQCKYNTIQIQHNVTIAIYETFHADWCWKYNQSKDPRDKQMVELLRMDLRAPPYVYSLIPVSNDSFGHWICPSCHCQPLSPVFDTNVSIVCFLLVFATLLFCQSSLLCIRYCSQHKIKHAPAKESGRLVLDLFNNYLQAWLIENKNTPLTVEEWIRLLSVSNLYNVHVLRPWKSKDMRSNRPEFDFLRAVPCIRALLKDQFQNALRISTALYLSNNNSNSNVPSSAPTLVYFGCDHYVLSQDTKRQRIDWLCNLVISPMQLKMPNIALLVMSKFIDFANPWLLFEEGTEQWDAEFEDMASAAQESDVTKMGLERALAIVSTKDAQLLAQLVSEYLNEELEPLFLDVVLSPMQMKVRVDDSLVANDFNFRKICKIAINPYYLCITFVDREVFPSEATPEVPPDESSGWPRYLNYNVMERYRVFMNQHGFKMASTQQFELLIPVCSDSLSSDKPASYQQRLYAIAKQMTSFQFYELVEKINQIRDEMISDASENLENEFNRLSLKGDHRHKDHSHPSNSKQQQQRKGDGNLRSHKNESPIHANRTDDKNKNKNNKSAENKESIRDPVKQKQSHSCTTTQTNKEILQRQDKPIPPSKLQPDQQHKTEERVMKGTNSPVVSSQMSKKINEDAQTNKKKKRKRKKNAKEKQEPTKIQQEQEKEERKDQIDIDTSKTTQSNVKIINNIIDASNQLDEEKIPYFTDKSISHTSYEICGVKLYSKICSDIIRKELSEITPKWMEYLATLSQKLIHYAIKRPTIKYLKSKNGKEVEQLKVTITSFLSEPEQYHTYHSIRDNITKLLLRLNRHLEKYQLSEVLKQYDSTSILAHMGTKIAHFLEKNQSKLKQLKEKAKPNKTRPITFADENEAKKAYRLDLLFSFNGIDRQNQIDNDLVNVLNQLFVYFKMIEIHETILKEVEPWLSPELVEGSSLSSY
ncbi:hypothetical protein RFI_21702 [Reticulomyxa filosa]|uniref:Uncharacterized protein n=1 Tax=Reticulomyxa filosa TaxID=46433 RepID=X6MP72_RETFI|nr:hypothetical protein RFI_21702 [Reticulomyxa filosa]|eukprot:ETO15664.1 hypothetical protein RFI_21702 [Reticulomyxa filosa]